MKFKIAPINLAFLFLLSSCTQGIGIPTPTPVVMPEAVQVEELSKAVTPSPVPFQFSLPTPGAEPVSGWRPPLYPVPWAMSAYDHFYFVRPIAADQINWPLADYRYGGTFFGSGIVHTGVDIDAEEGAPIMSSGPGTVVWAGWGLFTETPGYQNDPYGLAVGIRHDFGYNNQQLYTVYAHMSAVKAFVSEHVETGDVIGYVGSTGATTGPHVHFEVRVGANSFQNTRNPELWIAPPQGWGVLAGRMVDTEGDPLARVEMRVLRETPKKTYIVKTYGSGGAINADPYYNENLVLGDLPAGIYKLTMSFNKNDFQTWVEIFPGQVTYFTFEGDNGFSAKGPPAPKLKFLPQVLPPTPTTLP